MMELDKHEDLRVRYDISILDRGTGALIQRVAGETDGAVLAVKQGEAGKAWAVTIGGRRDNLELLGRALACTVGNNEDVIDADRSTRIRLLGGWAGAAVGYALQLLGQIGRTQSRI